MTAHKNLRIRSPSFTYLWYLLVLHIVVSILWKRYQVLDFVIDCIPSSLNHGCKTQTDKNHLAAANAWGNSRSDLRWNRKAPPDRRVSIGQNPKFPVWPMRPAREQHAVLVAGHVPAQILCRRELPQAFARALARHKPQNKKPPGLNQVAF
jgi:hypothetical protein